MSVVRPILHFASIADERFFPGLSVAVASAVASASGTSDYHFWILDGGIPEQGMRHLRAVVSSIARRKGMVATVELLNVNMARLMTLPALRGSCMTYAKMLLPEVLPAVDSLVYIDADVLCFTGLEDAVPSAGGRESEWLLAGARDYIDVIERDCPWKARLSSDELRMPYINAGVMWMNLKGMRELDYYHIGMPACPTILDAAAVLLREFPRIKGFRHDQTLFNFLCRGRSFILPETINHRTSLGAGRLLCEGGLDLNIHYIGAPKPWLGLPRTSSWLAHCLWHQARAALFPDADGMRQLPIPGDVPVIRRKALIHSLINPARAMDYRNDLRSLGDPGGVMETARAHWRMACA